MPTSRPFAYNTGSVISGTQQFGSIAVGTPTSGVTGNPKWWNGPDEDLGYVIAQSVPDNVQPAPDGSTASIGFFRSTALTESSFISIAQAVAGNQTFASGNAAYTWLTGNSYWTSWVLTSTGVTFSQTFTGGTSAGTTIENAWTTFRTSLTGSYTTFTWSSTNGNSITVTDSTKVQLIANALRTGTTGTNFSTTIGSNTWRVIQNCSTTAPVPAQAIEFTNQGGCSCNSGYTIRPLIRNQNWGGTNQSACNAPTQTITITFS